VEARNIEAMSWTLVGQSNITRGTTVLLLRPFFPCSQSVPFPLSHLAGDRIDYAGAVGVKPVFLNVLVEALGVILEGNKGFDE